MWAGVRERKRHPGCGQECGRERGFPDVGRSAEEKEASRMWVGGRKRKWPPGRVLVSGKALRPGGIGLGGLGQRCGELIANCD